MRIDLNWVKYASSASSSSLRRQKVWLSVKVSGEERSMLIPVISIGSSFLFLVLNFFVVADKQEIIDVHSAYARQWHASFVDEKALV